VNINAMIVSQLRKRREKVAAELAGIEAALAAFGGSIVGPPAAPVRTRKRRRKAKADPVTGLTPIQKAQAALKAKREAAKAATATSEEDPIAKARRERLAQHSGEGHPLSKGASLAEAAS
jgi:hypothetical protein